MRAICPGPGAVPVQPSTEILGPRDGSPSATGETRLRLRNNRRSRVGFASGDIVSGGSSGAATSRGRDMRHPRLTAALLGGSLLVSACARPGSEADVSRTIAATAEAEAESIREIMMAAAEPPQAVAWFRSRLDAEPGSLDRRRDLAQALVRAGRHTEAVPAWRAVVEHSGAGNDDAVDLASALMRTSDLDGAQTALAAVPDDHGSFERYRLEAIIADSQSDWTRADEFYRRALDLAPRPAGLLNNWGYSKLSRGDSEAAERLFTQALTYDAELFTAKNNLVMARAARGTYTLPMIPMTSEDKAQLLHTAGLAAVKRGDVEIGRGLFEDAIATHPRHFDPAVSALRALDA